jgi:hypothetical protein
MRTQADALQLRITYWNDFIAGTHNWAGPDVHELVAKVGFSSTMYNES